eukprot:jgi/Tetstr1/445720/TSEL_033368.t1
MTNNGTRIGGVDDNEIRALCIAGRCVVMKPLLGAGVNSPEGTVILKHLITNLGFNASGFGIVEVCVGSHFVTCLNGRGLPVLAQEVVNFLFPLRP